ncbi:glycosyltransferase family 2 protein [Bradyrhizobium diazoefficiens]|nr:glycosyltransferase family 2 protein [Bradyrhizobium diazoefficiens]
MGSAVPQHSKSEFSSECDFRSSSGFVGLAHALPTGGSASPFSTLATSSSPAHVAILLAVKDGARFLPEQLESYVQQTHTDWSLHVSDDGSKDRTIEIVQDFARRVSNSVTLRSGPCAGANSNFLSLLRDASIEADYFAFSDQDDVWCPDKLERALDLVRTAPGDHPTLYGSRTELIDRKGCHSGFSIKFKKPPSFRNALVQSIAGGNTMVFNRAARELLKRVADGNVIIHDWMTYIVISAVGGTIFYDRKPSVKYRQHGDNLVGSNLSFRARARRVKMLFEGQWKEWNSIHLKELERLLPDITDENRKVLKSFVQMREADGIVQRCWHLRKSGVYRQTLLGEIGLLFAAMFGKV